MGGRGSRQRATRHYLWLSNPASAWRADNSHIWPKTGQIWGTPHFLTTYPLRFFPRCIVLGEPHEGAPTRLSFTGIRA